MLESVPGINRCIWNLGPRAPRTARPLAATVTRERLDLLREADAHRDGGAGAPRDRTTTSGSARPCSCRSRSTERARARDRAADPLGAGHDRHGRAAAGRAAGGAAGDAPGACPACRGWPSTSRRSRRARSSGSEAACPAARCAGRLGPERARSPCSVLSRCSPARAVAAWCAAPRRRIGASRARRPAVRARAGRADLLPPPLRDAGRRPAARDPLGRAPHRRKPGARRRRSRGARGRARRDARRFSSSLCRRRPSGPRSRAGGDGWSWATCGWPWTRSCGLPEAGREPSVSSFAGAPRWSAPPGAHRPL